ncbi:hypothetical protein MTO96_026439 [Rhipicephalus appendiculatus]
MEKIYRKIPGYFSGYPDVKSCSFEVTATFYGTFVYHRKGEQIEDGGYVSVSVGKLGNSSKNLTTVGENLQYKLKGIILRQYVFEINDKSK